MTPILGKLVGTRQTGERLGRSGPERSKNERLARPYHCFARRQAAFGEGAVSPTRRWRRTPSAGGSSHAFGRGRPIDFASRSVRPRAPGEGRYIGALFRRAARPGRALSNASKMGQITFHTGVLRGEKRADYASCA